MIPLEVMTAPARHWNAPFLSQVGAWRQHRWSDAEAERRHYRLWRNHQQSVTERVSWLHTADRQLHEHGEENRLLFDYFDTVIIVIVIVVVVNVWIQVSKQVSK